MNKLIESEYCFNIALRILHCIPLMIPMIFVIDYVLAFALYIGLVATVMLALTMGLHYLNYEIEE